MRRLLHGLAVCLALCLPIVAQAGSLAAGEAIYRNGILPSGQPLEGRRDAGLRITGAAAACANCHRRSGLGMTEGRQSIPPVAGVYLFRPRAGTADADELPFVEGMRADREPYTTETLARAIREGVGTDGRAFSDLMPRYTLDDAELTALTAYLKALSPGSVPGVTATVLHFATIITPDADAAKRQGVLDVLEKFFEDKNRYTRAESPRLNSGFRIKFKAPRHWELHVWELSGAPQTWEQQLAEKLETQPVFAVISGVGGRTWAPIHHFCEARALPCLFPNVDLPVDAEDDYETLYFSKGVLLEAGLIARQLSDEPSGADIRRIVQVFRSDDIGADAASALTDSVVGMHVAVVNRSLAADAPPHALMARMDDLGPGDALVLWLRPEDIAALGAPPEQVARVFLSGRMGGLEQAPLPAAWRDVGRLTYPVDLPDKRIVRINFPQGWFRIRQVPVVALPEQVDTYLALNILSDTINRMSDTFVQDYLVERIEEMLAHRVMTGYYPRLTLAPAQRFASKGGYIVRFADAQTARVVADSAWIVP